VGSAAAVRLAALGIESVRKWPNARSRFAQLEYHEQSLNLEEKDTNLQLAHETQWRAHALASTVRFR
jgi:hypothetical protein